MHGLSGVQRFPWACCHPLWGPSQLAVSSGSGPHSRLVWPTRGLICFLLRPSVVLFSRSLALPGGDVVSPGAWRAACGAPGGVADVALVCSRPEGSTAASWTASWWVIHGHLAHVGSSWGDCRIMPHLWTLVMGGDKQESTGTEGKGAFAGGGGRKGCACGCSARLVRKGRSTYRKRRA